MKEGRRVIAVSHSEDKEMFIFGHGVYEGDFVPGDDDETRPAGMLGEMMYNLGHSNPRIRLDNGKVVWGCECWWGDADNFATKYAGYTITEVDIDASRAKANQGSEG